MGTAKIFLLTTTPPPPSRLPTRPLAWPSLIQHDLGSGSANHAPSMGVDGPCWRACMWPRASAQSSVTCHAMGEHTTGRSTRPCTLEETSNMIQKVLVPYKRLVKQDPTFYLLLPVSSGFSTARTHPCNRSAPSRGSWSPLAHNAPTFPLTFPLPLYKFHFP